MKFTGFILVAFMTDEVYLPKPMDHPPSTLACFP